MEKCLMRSLFFCLAGLCFATGGWLSAEDQSDPLAVFATEFVGITPGEGKFPSSFEMGAKDGRASQPVHEVRMTGPFSMARYEVPQNLYEQVMGLNPSKWKGPRNSVEMLTPAEARTFCEKATQLLRERKLIGENEEIRLPTEAEWEYCCRAGTTTRYSFGDDALAPRDDGKTRPGKMIVDKYAWYTGNAAGNDPPVGALAPNPWGLYDMHGYLLEICSDPWRADYADTTEVTTDGSVAIRGGSWKDKYTQLTSASRQKFEKDGKDDAVGFRCVRVVAKSK